MLIVLNKMGNMPCDVPLRTWIWVTLIGFLYHNSVHFCVQRAMVRTWRVWRVWRAWCVWSVWRARVREQLVGLVVARFEHGPCHPLLHGQGYRVEIII